MPVSKIKNNSVGKYKSTGVSGKKWRNGTDSGAKNTNA